MLLEKIQLIRLINEFVEESKSENGLLFSSFKKIYTTIA